MPGLPLPFILQLMANTGDFFKISNEYRPGLKEVIGELEKDYELHLISGDNEAEIKNLERFFQKQKQHPF